MWNFSPLAPASKLSRSRDGFPIRPVGIIDAGKVDQRIGEESAGVGIVERGQGLLESLPPTAVEVDHRADAGRVHLVEVVLDALGRESRLAAAEMVVHVDDREGRLGDLGHLGDQHRARLPVAELQLLDIVLFLGSDDVGNQQAHGE